MLDILNVLGKSLTLDSNEENPELDIPNSNFKIQVTDSTESKEVS